MPDWLETILRHPQRAQFPLREVLQDSLYYPASGLNGTPIKHLAGNFYSFVYADYGLTRSQFLDHLNGTGEHCGFRYYHSVVQREVTREEIVPGGWVAPMMPTDPTALRRLADSQRGCQPFGHWSVWQRNYGVGEEVGPLAFSFFFLAGEMSAIYQGLYNRLSLAPKVLAIIQPGHIGGEWEGIPDNASFFKQVVLANPAGMPEYLMYGGYGEEEDYPEACWTEYTGPLIARLKERRAGLWRLNQQVD